MGEHIMPVYTTIISFVAGILTYKVKKLIDENAMLRKETKDHQQAISDGVMYLLRVKLIEYHDRYTHAGVVPSYAFQNFEEMYQAYHTLGGNGMITHMYEEMKALRIDTLHGEPEK